MLRVYTKYFKNAFKSERTKMIIGLLVHRSIIDPLVSLHNPRKRQKTRSFMGFGKIPVMKCAN